MSKTDIANSIEARELWGMIERFCHEQLKALYDELDEPASTVDGAISKNTICGEIRFIKTKMLTFFDNQVK